MTSEEPYLSTVVDLSSPPPVTAAGSYVSQQQQQQQQVVVEIDVVVIGAGLAGLTAADEVRRAGLSCVVLEARDRVGGKTWSAPLQPESEDGGKGGAHVDLGAAWLNDTNQSRVIALARRFGAELVEQNTRGRCALQDFDGRCSAFPYGELPGVCVLYSFSRTHAISITITISSLCVMLWAKLHGFVKS